MEKGQALEKLIASRPTKGCAACKLKSEQPRLCKSLGSGLITVYDR